MAIWVTKSHFLTRVSDQGAPSIVAESSPADDGVGLQELLVNELRDLLHAEKQLHQGLAQMAKAARFDRLRELFEIHLAETEEQIERIDECFDLMGETARAKPCKGMQGLVEEGQEVMEEGARKRTRQRTSL